MSLPRLFAVVVLAIVIPIVRADVKLPAVLGSHMVLQREIPLAIWGWADSGEKVTVRFEEQTVSAEADASCQ